MGGNRTQHVGRRQRPARHASEGCHLHWQPQALRPIHATGNSGMAKQLRQCPDGLRAEQEGVDRSRCVRACPAMPGGHHQGGMGEAGR